MTTETVSAIASGTDPAMIHNSSRSFARSSGERGWRNVRAVAVSLRGTAVLADRGRLEQRGAFGDERARPHRLSALTHHRFGLAGEVGLIECQPVGLDQRPIGHDLFARRQPHEVAGDHLLDGHATIGSVANHPCVGGHQRCEPVELALGADLLEGPDRDVRHQDPEKQRISPRRERDREHPEHEQDRVGNGERVGTDDARVRTARPLARRPAARGQAPAGLGAGQPLRRRPRSRRHDDPGSWTLNSVERTPPLLAGRTQRGHPAFGTARSRGEWPLRMRQGRCRATLRVMASATSGSSAGSVCERRSAGERGPTGRWLVAHRSVILASRGARRARHRRSPAPDGRGRGR